MKHTLTRKLLNTALLGILVTVPALGMSSSASADSRSSRHSVRKQRTHKRSNVQHRRTPRNIHPQRNIRPRTMTLTGRVTRMGSAGRFNIRSGNRTYNIYPSHNSGRRVRRGDTVRVHGQQRGNDIRNANVAIVRH